MKKYILKVDTNWCGTDWYYGVILKDDTDPASSDLVKEYEQLAYEHYESYGYSEEDEEFEGDENYYWSIEECTDDGEFEDLEVVIDEFEEYK